MKLLIWNYIKTILLLAGIESVLFVTMIFFLMTDESIGVIGKSLSFIVKYIMGFPLVLINNNYPFFLDCNKPPSYMIFLIIGNLIVHAGIVLLVKKLLNGLFF